jgi:hypothetical protein
VDDFFPRTTGNLDKISFITFAKRYRHPCDS